MMTSDSARYWMPLPVAAGFDHLVGVVRVPVEGEVMISDASRPSFCLGVTTLARMP
jgi:hypothetical protein